jgi:hypothetical protein
MAFYRGLLAQYVDVSNLTLNIIPISIGAIHTEEIGGKPVHKLLSTNFNRQKSISLLAQQKKALRPGGMMTDMVEKLLPPLMTMKGDNELADQFNAELEILLPNYEVKTNRAEYNVDKIVEAAKISKRFTIFNSFKEETDEVKALTKSLEALGFKEVNNIFKYTSENASLKEKEEKFREAIKIYVEHAKKHRNNNLISLKNAVRDAFNSTDRHIS